MANGGRPRIAGRPAAPNLFRRWYAAKSPVFQFALKFGALILAAYLVLLLPLCTGVTSASVEAYARLASVILNCLGEHTHATDATIWSAHTAITVSPACSALRYIWFFCAAVIAFPVAAGRKVLGILLGSALLYGLNLIRVTSLFYIGAHFGRFFDMVHEQLWGLVLIVAEVSLCVLWVNLARREGRS